jgi:hypothetical protein
MKSWVIQKMPERFDPKVSTADVFVAINSAPEFAAAIVKMKRPDPLDAQQPIERRYRRFIFLLGSHRIPGGKDMAGVEAESKTVGLSNTVKNRGELLEPPTECGALARGGFQQAPSLQIASLGRHAVDRPNDVSQAARLGCSRKCAWMSHDIGNFENFGPMQFRNKGINRLSPQLGIGARQIDEVRVVDERMGYAERVHCGTEPRDVIRRNVSGCPLVVVFRKQLDAVTTAPMRTIHRTIKSARNRFVSAENGHIATLAEGCGKNEGGLKGLGSFAISVDYRIK